MKTARTLNNKTYYFVSSVKQFTDNRVPLSFLCISKSDTKRHNQWLLEERMLIERIRLFLVTKRNMVISLLRLLPPKQMVSTACWAFVANTPHGTLVPCVRGLQVESFLQSRFQLSASAHPRRQQRLGSSHPRGSPGSPPHLLSSDQPSPGLCRNLDSNQIKKKKSLSSCFSFFVLLPSLLSHSNMSK